MRPHWSSWSAKFFGCLLWALSSCTLSCSYGEHLGSYLDSQRMVPPVDEPLSFEVVGHRGYGSTTPENTLAALNKSIKEKIKVAEVDIRLTSDGIPVLLHDESLSRTTGDPRRISELTLAEVKKLDAGSYKSLEYQGEQIPTLDEALQLTRGRIKLLLHMKLSETGPVIADTIGKTAFPPDDIWIMSDQLEALLKMSRLLPAVRLVHLVFKLPSGPAAQRKYVQNELNAHATCTALALDVPDDDYMTMAHHQGLRVLFWTADHPYDSVEVDRFTADGVIANKPLMWEDWAALIRVTN